MPVGRASSYMARNESFRPQWRFVDATDQVLGRLAAKIATVLMGKHRPIYTAHVDTGDFVVVTNAEKFKLTGNKLAEMHYDRYSYYPGGWKRVTGDKMLEKHPERIVHTAVRRMLPKNALGRKMLKKLKVYVGPNHPHSAQRPVPLEDEA